MRCRDCGEEFETIGHHWSQTNCSHPTITQRQEEIIKGLLLGDGCINRQDKTPALYAVNTKVKFLDWIKSEFKSFPKNMYTLRTAEEIARVFAKRRGIEQDESDFNDCYALRIAANPNFRKFQSWYTDNGIQFPEDLTLSKLSAKVWYASDGGLGWTTDTSAQAIITTQSQGYREKYLKSLFEDVGLNPGIYDQKRIIFEGYEKTKKFLNFLGDPLPGYEYKWEIRDKEKYYELKDGRKYKSDRRRKCEKVAQALNLNTEIAEEAYQSIKQVNMDKFGNATERQICFCQVCLTANENNIFVQQRDEYGELANEMGDYSFRNKIKERLRDNPQTLA